MSHSSIKALLLGLSFLTLVSCTKDHSNLKGIWVGTADVKPFPEFIKLNYDSVPQVQLFYNQVSQETVIDFDGSQFFKAMLNEIVIDDKIIEKYAPNVVEGTKKLSNWAKNL